MIHVVRPSNRDVDTCAHAVLEGAMAIARHDRDSRSTRGLEVKTKDLVHHSVVTSADYASQKAILEYLTAVSPTMPIITEEKVGSEFHGKILKADDPESVKDALMRPEGVNVVDPLCGSSSHNAGPITAGGRTVGGPYAITSGVMRLDSNGLDVLAGAVREPDFKGGVLYHGSPEDGTTVAIGGKYVKTGKIIVRLGGQEVDAMVNPRIASLKNALVEFNADFPIQDIYPVLYKALGRLSSESRTTYGIESCGGAMGRVAAGWFNGMVHTPISPEHWVGGAALILGAGGTIIFYTLDESGKPVRLEKLEVKHLLPGKRSVGFVTGSEPIAEQLMDILVKAGRGV